jgi:hypothetical protein
MSKETYEAMTRKELRDYLRSDRNNQEAWKVFFDKLEQETTEKTSFPYTDSLEETEQHLKNYLEKKRNSKT